jgi:hypothetical protein
LFKRVDGGVDSPPIEHEPAEKLGSSGRLVAQASSGEYARGAGQDTMRRRMSPASRKHLTAVDRSL